MQFIVHQFYLSKGVKKETVVKDLNPSDALSKLLTSEFDPATNRPFLYHQP